MNITKLGINPYRWFELAFSVPLVVMVCAISLGANDFLFLLTQMVLAAAIVIIGYGQEREKFVNTTRDVRFPWFPLSSATGLFYCQWALIFWNAYEARAFINETQAFGFGPTTCYLAGATATVYVMACTSTYATSAFELLFKPIKNCDAEIWQQSISCATRVLVTLLCIPLLSRLK
jgi:hypothetical protein